MSTEFWHEWRPGERVVVRYRLDGGLSDALGYVRRNDATGLEVETRRGLVRVPAEAITLGKLVPPPPPRRGRRNPA